VLAPAQAVIGDFHGLQTAKYQPAKLAAIEAHWPAHEVAPLVLFAWPNDKAERNDFEIAIPRLGSFIILHDWNGIYPGLKAFTPENRPPVPPVFFAFRVMVGIGLLIIALSLAGGVLWWRGTLFVNRAWLTAASWAWPLGFTAIVAGWFVTEIGRQPWIAAGILRTAEARSPVAAATVAITLALFVVVYAAVFGTGILYINRLVNRGPDEAATAEPRGTPTSPLSAAADAARHAPQPAS
jgi:cytochrome d ubiquinol oxidase subunit I